MAENSLKLIQVRLSNFGDKIVQPFVQPQYFEFHIAKDCRDYYHFDKAIFTISGNVILTDLQAVKSFALKLNKKRKAKDQPQIRPGHLNAMGMIDEILHYVIGKYKQERNPRALKKALNFLNRKFGQEKVIKTITRFVELFPPIKVYIGEQTVSAYLKAKTGGIPNLLISLEEMLLLYLANENPAFSQFLELFDDRILTAETSYQKIAHSLSVFFKTQPVYGPYNQALVDLLKAPVLAAPNSLTGQLLYIKDNWGLLLSSELFDRLLIRILVSLDLIKEEERPEFLGPGPALVLKFMPESELYQEFYQEEEHFSPDTDWMPRVVMIAKHTYVWLHQLSKKYGRLITKLDEIPDEEFDMLSQWGFTSLWLIGVWQRSKTSQKIKQLCGNPEALSSAYSIYDYEIADELGGKNAFDNLKHRAMKRNIRIAVDMVPNHTGIYSRWVREHADWFIQSDYPPFPNYRFSGQNLSEDSRFGIYIEDGYYSRTDAAVAFKLVDHRTNSTRYIFHGNDGTSMPWNDTAQLNFLLPRVREAVINQILHVAKKSSIIRLDAAMTLAKKHYQRLWFPEPGKGGDIPSRTEFGMSKARFNKLFPREFWREVVDRIAQEAPNTLLLAEAFWLMEGYFVRTLGMHRVYNSAFMNMLKMEENQNYRSVIKNVLEFNPEILRRFVNFMNNPDELPAITQFGNGDKYFGVVMMMATMPGLPMFGHGQIEGFSEKYGMEYKRAYWDENINWDMIHRHEREIFPLLKKRYLFSGVQNFLLYDFYEENGKVNENVFAYSNRYHDEKAIILYNNIHQEARGWIRLSAAFSLGGKLVRKNLDQDLGFKRQPGYYYIFRDRRFNLEYIRTGKELCDKGLYVELGAFQYHIFMDFQEIIDNEAGDHKILTKFLHGCGVPDMREAMTEMKMAPVLKPFREIMNPDVLQKIKSYGNKNLFEQKIFNLLSAIKNFACVKGDELVIANYLNELLKIITIDLNKLISYPMKTLKPAATYMKSKGLKDDHNILLIWLITHALAKIKSDYQYEKKSSLWLDEWLFGKVIKQTFISLGDNDFLAQRHVLLVKILTASQYFFEEAEKIGEKIRNLLTDEDVKNYIGLNLYDGVIWFNKEYFENLIYWLFTISVLKAIRNNKSITSRILNRFRLIKKISKLANASGYRFEDLLERLIGK